MSIKMKDVFCLPVSHHKGGVMPYMKDNNGQTIFVGDNEHVLPTVIAINNHDALVTALEWALERAEPEVRETDNSMDQMMLIKYQTLLQELKC